MAFRVNATSEQYLKRLAPRMEGWLDIASARVIVRLLEHQAEAGIAGSLLEIGVHHGKLFLLMALNARPGEALIACDLFGLQEQNVDRSGRGDLSVFLENAARAGIATEQITVIERNSLQVAPEELRAPGGPVRFASIDGGHTAEITASDLRLVDAVLDPRGAVVVDDVFNQYWPDVAAGFFRYLDGPGAGLVPFAISQNKTYLARPEMADSYREALATRCRPGLQRRKILLGHEVLVLHALSMVARRNDRPLSLDMMIRGVRRRVLPRR
jgi:predicted O-methyltransferase YrrM